MRALSRAFAALVTVGLAATGVATLASSPALAEPGTVVISQVYGGGGSAGAPLTNDYVELFNRSAAPVVLDGWSVQYASATGTGNFAANPVVPLTGTLAPGQYHLLQLAGGANGSPLPAPDGTGTINLSGSAGKVALVRSAQGLACNGGSVLCAPEQAALIADLIGYGTANYFEGTAAPGLSVTTAGLRKDHGCADTDDNGADVEAAAPAPRNRATDAAPCGDVEPTPTPTPTPTVEPTVEPTPTPTPTGEPCEIPVTHQIAQVQGSGDVSPLAGQVVRVEGIVTADFQETNQLSGFFFQDPTPDADPATSEGLFAFARSSFKDVKVGDRVLVTGKVVEFNGWTELSPVTAVDVCGTGTIAPAKQSLPRAEGTTFESVENMLVTFPEPLTLSDHYNLGRYGEITVSSEGRIFQPTDRPGVTTAKNARRSLLVDDASTVENPPAIPYVDRRLRLGDTAFGVTGVMGYGFGKYRLQPTKPLNFLPLNPRLPAPFPVIGNVKVASFNALNWFTTLRSRGASSPEEQKRQLTKLVAALKGVNADVVGLMEIQNNGQTAIQALVDALNAEVGAGTYAALSHPYPGTDVIQVAMIYKPARIQLVGAAQSSTDPVFRRPPLIQTFRRVQGGKSFTVLVNHYKSKGCDEEAVGPDADQGDGQSCYNGERVRQAQATLGLIKDLKLTNPMVLGDLNAYGEEDPMDVLEAGGLSSTTKRFVPEPLRYSYLFDGQLGELDHALVGKDLLKRVTSATIWHINSDESRIYDYNLEYNPPGLYKPDAFRASDHDPVIVGLTL
ncbi:ExeM/NucH family extracellular endonuclease [Streptosporangium sp. NPDC001681]|uniref:ExeM/NucH family extracellular endonuclease n=1 Tax=Streptosporangium sp. NPDC001681 TaxID=3154395 RepID=UPI003328C4D5